MINAIEYLLAVYVVYYKINKIKFPDRIYFILKLLNHHEWVGL
jgi:hypothetical protein